MTTKGWTANAESLLSELERLTGPVETWDDQMGVQFSAFVDLSGLPPDVVRNEFQRREAARKKRGSRTKGGRKKR
jgi:hypothetical protein